jgi:predicted RNase H-like HicB family nuclease
VCPKWLGTYPGWTHIPDERVNELTNSYGAWHIAYDKLSGAHTLGDVITKNEAREDGEEVLRAYHERDYSLKKRIRE